MQHTLYFGTNRNHLGTNRWKPDGYGKQFSSDGRENLRFGHISFSATDSTVQSYLTASVHDRTGDGVGLSKYLETCLAENGSVTAYEDQTQHQVTHPDERPSARFFEAIKAPMMAGTDVLVYVHGYNVSWLEAIAAAAALQITLAHHGKNLMVVPFTWPSNGSIMPYKAYYSDRDDASLSGLPVARALILLRDFILRRRHAGELLCNSHLHLLCHSMGNFLMEHTLQKMASELKAEALPKMFDHVVLAAADVHTDAFENQNQLARLPELCNGVSVYFNSGDMGMIVSDLTKFHPDRLGQVGAANPYKLNRKVQLVNCSGVVKGLVEHSYYLWADVNHDIAQTLSGLEPNHPTRRRRQGQSPNEWVVE